PGTATMRYDEFGTSNRTARRSWNATASYCANVRSATMVRTAAWTRSTPVWLMEGISTAAMMPRIATTARSSKSVKPRRRERGTVEARSSGGTDATGKLLVNTPPAPPGPPAPQPQRWAGRRRRAVLTLLAVLLAGVLDDDGRHLGDLDAEAGVEL